MKNTILILFALIFLTATGCSDKNATIPVQDVSTPISSGTAQSKNTDITPTEHETIEPSIKPSIEPSTKPSIEPSTKPSIEPIPTYFNDPNVEEYPQLIHSAKEWLSKGYLDYPFKLNDYSYREDEDYNSVYESVRFYIPQEALEQAATEDLVRIVGQMQKYPAHAYDFPSYYIESISSWFNAVDEMRTREDFPKVLLESYIKSEFMPVCTFEDSKRQLEYDVEAHAIENEILSKEIFLACNSTFDRMDDEMRRRTFEAIMEKNEKRKKDEYNYISSMSGFFAYVNELQNFGHEERMAQEDGTMEYVTLLPVGSKWYDYIAYTLQEDEIIGYINSLK